LPNSPPPPLRLTGIRFLTKCALVNPSALLPPSTTCGGTRPFFVLSSIGAPSSPANSPPALLLVPAAIESFCLPCSSTGDPRARGPSPLSPLLALLFLPSRRSLPLVCSLCRRWQRAPPSLPPPPATHGGARPLLAPAPSPQTLCALAPVWPAAADTAEE
jgi:hypothetical protein